MGLFDDPSDDMSGWMTQDNPFGGGGISDPGGIDPGYVPYPTTPDFGSHYGMGDRGLGTDNPYDPGGTLTAGEIAQLGGSSGGIGDALSKFAKMFGLTNKDGSVNLSSLIPLLATGIGGYMGYKSTKKASQQMQDAINQSNQIVKDTLAPISGMYQPYADLGKQAAARYANMQPSNLAANFGNLAGNFGPLEGDFKPLGSGRGISVQGMAKLGK